ncbi:CYFA0S06e04588g1_1 [Cyberlindnera fabianii]|uniref:Mitochondrial distribution and morphology protein 12 n=1 Tax=Cyberlindnera fabianii TaxID=36022 RepID=A0A061B0R3_CYBFA|nr:Mitochondrial distribution and morphology protein 12 [Cyberlindnera fabianii]CDR41237.1 CYFA0S06e04588g1_1 [Cyberlindnera fabianii]
MSIDINWQDFGNDTSLSESIRSFLDEQFSSLPLPDFLRDLHVANVCLGTIAPEVTIRHIGAPFPEFYIHQQMDKRSDEETPDGVKGRNKSVEINKGIILDHSSNLGTSSEIGDNGTSDAAIEDQGNEDTEDRSRDIQFLVELEYKGDVSIELHVDLLLNYPSPGFIKLPVKLRIVDLGIHSLAVISHVNKVVYISFLCDVTDEQFDSLLANPQQLVSRDQSYRPRIDIIRTLKIESEIGDSQGDGSVLRNVGKVEKFLTDMLRQVLRDELAWPGWISLDFNDEESDEEDEDDQQNEDSVDPLEP